VLNAAKVALPVAAAIFVGKSLLVLIGSLGLAVVLGALAYVYYFIKIYGAQLGSKTKIPDMGGVKRLMFHSTLATLAFAVYLNLDTVLVNALLTPSGFALYKIAQQIFIGVASLSPVSYLLLFTYFIKLDAEMDAGGKRLAYEKAMKYGALFAIPASIFLIMLAPQIINLIYPESYAASAAVLSAFGIAPLFYVIFANNVSILGAHGRMKEIAKLYVLAIVVYAAGLALLAPSYGVVGAALASVGAYAVAAIASYFIVRRLAFGPRIRADYFTRPLAFGIAAALATWLVRAYVTTNGIALLVTYPLALALLYLPFATKEDWRVAGAALSVLRKV